MSAITVPSPLKLPEPLGVLAPALGFGSTDVGQFAKVQLL
jgi:hypothetical protein